VWQLAFGSGFKFNSAVLQANRRILDRHAAWEVRKRFACIDLVCRDAWCLLCNFVSDMHYDNARRFWRACSLHARVCFQVKQAGGLPDLTMVL
jgi:hypothetical protein